MRQNTNILTHLDWSTVSVYLILVAIGWLNLYSSEYDPDRITGLTSLSFSYERQLIWILASFILIIFILILDFNIYESFAFFFYFITLLLLIIVLIYGITVNGAKAWIVIGSFRIQPAELTKFTTALLLAYVIAKRKKLGYINNQISAILVIIIPIFLIMRQPDFGSAIIFASFIIPMYREGFSSTYPSIIIAGVLLFVSTLLIPRVTLLITLGILNLLLIFIFFRKNKKATYLSVFILVLSIIFVLSIDYLLNKVLKKYQKDRIEVIFNPRSVNPLKEGWNLEQSKIAIGSGGFEGKGFLKGTQTKYGYVPEQTTDFIFSTLAEEHGWLGSLLLITLFLVLTLRCISIAERQKRAFARIYGYCVASILFFHFAINLAMTMGLFPIVGIPLPFISYGGSSLWSFTIMLFVLLKIDMHRMQVLAREH